MKRLFIVLIFLIFCVGCNQNTDYKNNQQQIKSEINNQTTLLKNTSIPEKSNISSSQNHNNKSEVNEMNITMKTELDSYPQTTETLKVTITNNSDFEYKTGKGYYIEYYNGSSWNKIPLEFFVHDIAISLPPQESKEFKINLYPEQYQYKSGIYRIYKTIYNSDAKSNIYAQFNIK